MQTRSLKIPHHLSLGRSEMVCKQCWRPRFKLKAPWHSHMSHMAFNGHVDTFWGSKKCVFSSESFPCGIRVIMVLYICKTSIVVSSRLWVFCLNRRKRGSWTLVSIFYSRWWKSCNTTIHHIYHIYKPTVFRRPSPPKNFPHCFTHFSSFPNRWSDQTPLATGTRSCHLSAQWQLQARPLHWMGPEAHQGSVSRWKAEHFLKQALSTTLFEWDVWVKQPFAQ